MTMPGSVTMVVDDVDEWILTDSLLITSPIIAKRTVLKSSSAFADISGLDPGLTFYWPYR